MKKKAVAAKHKTASSAKESTIHDIARVSGVSIGTVSRALNNKPGVHPKTRERVLAVSRDMNVKSRVGARRKQIAILVADKKALMSETYAGALCANLMFELSHHDMFGMYIASDEIVRLTREIFDGIVTTSWKEEDMDVLRSIAKTPIIMARCCKSGDEVLLAGWNHRTEGAIVAEYLINKGHQRIAMLHMHPDDPLSLERRWEGFSEKASEMKFPSGGIQCQILESRNRMAPMLKKLVDDGVDGVWMPGHQYIAAEGLKILQEVIGVRVPRDISVIGSENSGVSPLLQPALTTIAAPFQELAASIVDRLIQQMNTEPERAALEPILLQPFLIERDSVANRLARSK